MNIPLFRSKYPTEPVTLLFNFGPALSNGTTLVSASIAEISAINGQDPASSAMIIGNPSISTNPITLSNGTILPPNTTVLVSVNNGLDGLDYLIVVQVTTSVNGYSPVCRGILPVRRL